MLKEMSDFFAIRLKRFIPDAFVFALLLTLITAVMAVLWANKTPFEVVQSWYKGFWILLEFGMQVILLLVTGYTIAISAPTMRFIDWIATKIKTPVMVYGFVIFIGGIFGLISWGWVVLTAVLARELANRLPNIDYPYLTACVYFSLGPWVCGLSSSIPLLLNTEDNFLIESGVLDSKIAIASTLGSTLNIVVIVVFLILAPAIMILLRPTTDLIEIDDLKTEEDRGEKATVAQEADQSKLLGYALSDTLNNSFIIQILVSILGLWYIIWHFLEKGFDINLNIMIFIFIVFGMISHRTPLRYVIAMSRACSNVSGIVFQYPFYAGIMGMMIYTGLGEVIGNWMAQTATLGTFPFVAYLTGAIINFAIPSAGGEWAVVGPTLIEAAKNLSAGLPTHEVATYYARISMAVAYGESLTNLLQPFFLLLILPIMGAGVRIQARDVMGYFILPFTVFFILEGLFVTWLPM